MVDVMLDKLLDVFIRAPVILGGEAVQLGFQFLTESYFHMRYSSATI
jgi:hypothetical protein